MTKRMSKTLAAELAERTMKIENPKNRALALNEMLRKHGFGPLKYSHGLLPGERTAIAAWLLGIYAANE